MYSYSLNMKLKRIHFVRNRFDCLVSTTFSCRFLLASRMVVCLLVHGAFSTASLFASSSLSSSATILCLDLVCLLASRTLACLLVHGASSERGASSSSDVECTSNAFFAMLSRPLFFFLSIFFALALKCLR